MQSGGIVIVNLASVGEIKHASQVGGRKGTSETSQGYSVMKFPVISELMSSRLMQWTAVYFI